MSAVDMNRRRLVMLGLISSTLLMGAFAAFLCLWRVVPMFEVGAWSFRTHFWLTPESGCSSLAQAYYRAFDKGGTPESLIPWITTRLQPGGTTVARRQALIHFVCLRSLYSRAGDEVNRLGEDFIGEVLLATKDSDHKIKEGAVMFMEGLRRGNELYKPDLYAEDLQVRVQYPGHDQWVDLAHGAFERWWSRPKFERGEHDPFDGTGLVIYEP